MSRATRRCATPPSPASVTSPDAVSVSATVSDAHPVHTAERTPSVQETPAEVEDRRRGRQLVPQASDAERIQHIRRPRWIRYTTAHQILERMDDLYTHPRMHRMPNLLIVGETGNGKTMIVNRFLSRYPATDLASRARATLPVLSIQAPPVPEEGRFYNEILDRVAAPYRPNDRVERKQFQAVRVLREIGVRLLIIDEIHHILAGPIAKQRHFLNTIKYLSNELRIPMVGVGTKEAFHALHTDPQLASRFMPALLPRWELNEDYLRLLASFAQMLPLKQPSDLAAPDLAELVLTMSEGTIGEIAALLSTAAVAAIRTGRERIDTTLLRQLEWVVPSARKWQADRLG